MATKVDPSPPAGKSPSLTEQHGRLTALLQRLPGMVYRCRNDESWTLDFVAGRVEELTGYSAAELAGPSRLATPGEMIHPDDRRRVWDEIQAAIGAGRDYTIEYRLHARDGTLKWIWERGYAVRAPDGTVEALEGFMQDITERRRAEEQLRLSERLRRLVIDTEPECVKLVAPDGRLLEMNPAGLAMLEAESLEQAQHCLLLDYIAPAHRAAFAELHQRVMAGGHGTLEFEVVGLLGARRWLETRAVPMRDQHGTVTALLGVTRDVTRRRLQDERILRLSRVRAVLSSINALIVRTRSRAELFQEACRIAVEQGGFPLAWVALIRDDALLPVARHGADGGHLEDAHFPLRSDAPGACPASVRAVSERRAVVCADTATGAAEAGAWREPLLALGYRSFVAYPLVVSSQVVGVFHLYAREPGFFDDEEMALLRELAGDIGYALEFIIKDETLDFLSIYDPLTQLANRTLFLRRLEGYVHAAQNSGRRLALLMLDLERFKAINDAIGQAGGDALLKLVAERLKFHAGGASYVARIAGDRFAAVRTEIEPGVDVEAMVRGGGWDRLDPPFEHGGQQFPVTLKIGIAVFPQDGGDAEALLRNAELALKHGKGSGRRQTRYASEMSDAAMRKLELGRELRQAIDRDELDLHYQPKVDLRTGMICGAEALLRWNHGTRGLVMPATIIPLMEETGLIFEVGRWALARALRDAAAWRREPVAVPRIGINVSALELRERSFADAVREALGGDPAAGAGVEMEVTESMMMADPEASVATLRALRDLGITVSMDDFGTGYSSLAHLTRLPLNSVKIDRSFVAAMNRSTDTMSIVSTIVALAHSMNLKVVAEGVETPEQLQYLRVLRCDEIQGFLFSPPVPAAAFLALLKSGRKLP